MYLHPTSGRHHDYETGLMVSPRLLESGEYELVDSAPERVQRRVSARYVESPSAPAPPQSAPATPPSDTDPLPVMQPEFSAHDVPGPEPVPASEPAAPPDPCAAEPCPADHLPGTSSDCPHCGELPRACPEGHAYYEGSTLKECQQFTDMWVGLCQIAHASRGRVPVEIPAELRDRTSERIQSLSKRYPSMPLWVELPVLLTLVAGSCAVARDQAPAAQAQGSEPQEHANGTGNGAEEPQYAQGWSGAMRS